MDVANKESCVRIIYKPINRIHKVGRFKLPWKRRLKWQERLTLMTLKGMLSKEVTKFEQYSEYKDLILRILLWYVHAYGDYLDILYTHNKIPITHDINPKIWIRKTVLLEDISLVLQDIEYNLA